MHLSSLLEVNQFFYKYVIHTTQDNQGSSWFCLQPSEIALCLSWSFCRLSDCVRLCQIVSDCVMLRCETSWDWQNLLGRTFQQHRSQTGNIQHVFDGFTVGTQRMASFTGSYAKHYRNKTVKALIFFFSFFSNCHLCGLLQLQTVKLHLPLRVKCAIRSGFVIVNSQRGGYLQLEMCAEHTSTYGIWEETSEPWRPSVLYQGSSPVSSLIILYHAVGLSEAKSKLI